MGIMDHKYIVFLFCMLMINYIYSGPVWPKTFKVLFHESIYNKSTVLCKNKGAWYYDYANMRVRYDHLEGQINDFCQGQNLSPDKPRDDCHLIFSPSLEMFVHYPNQKTCCRLCIKNIGCTPLKPNWIQNGTFIGTEQIEGRTCFVYTELGAVARDYWIQTLDGSPCRYYETFPQQVDPVIFHNMTFFPATYSTKPIDDSIFAIPEYCNKDCPNPFPPNVTVY